MKRKHKIAFAAIAIIFVFISVFIGLWLLSYVGESYSTTIKFVLRFFLTVTPLFILLAVVNLLKEDK